MSKPLIIVESPAKARTIAGYLGSDYEVASSVGHIRDLPSTAAEIPKRFKEEPWARLGVNVDGDFEPIYITARGKSKVISELKAKLKNAPELFLATDEDREGESIAWHLREVLNPKVPVRRMVFHEITPQAIQAALDNPRQLDERLVDAQETRRVLDRLYGYEVSPVLWKKVKPRLSAGRVQSVAVRIIVERERERMAFVVAGYWDLTAVLLTAGDATFESTLTGVDGRRVATGRDFAADGTLTTGDVVRLDADAAQGLVEALTGAEFTVDRVETKPYTRKPQPPFRTSTLQQEAGRKLGFSASRAMSAAQRLYENGFITYMRTDSTTLSETALVAARAAAVQHFGSESIPAEPRTYGKKVKGAQEAHEAIRPAGDEFRHPDDVRNQVGDDEARVYDLIWRRTIASQMVDAKGESLRVTIGAVADDGRVTEFATSGRTITRPGFLAAYVRGVDEGDEGDDQERRLPTLTEGETLTADELTPVGHETRPPARYTEPSLVQRLEELGVGRPSTYASIIETIQNRGYVWKKGQALVPSFTAFATVALLERHFPDLVDYDFTAAMEADLDRIAEGEQDRTEWLREFYFGDNDGLKHQVEDRLEEIDPRLVNSIPISDDIVARVGRYGPYLERGDDRASIPEDLAPDELTPERAAQYLDAAAAGPTVFGTDPETGLEVLGLDGRYGPYVQLGEQVEGSKQKPKRASLLRGQSMESLTLADALRLLSIPRTLGVHPDTGEEIQARNGRFGPYISCGGESRSLPNEEAMFDITLEEALALLAQPKGGRRSAAPLKELGNDPNSGKPVVLKSGRYGPYVTDGITNASLTKTDDPDTLTPERAFQLLADRR